mmetsp:Transcript_44434/g.105270  ORF Transcript_44434/g.105270 Transcript_44434/m.105270 type:complete len:306 (+) Transcript_44434:116-1033(+)
MSFLVRGREVSHGSTSEFGSAMIPALDLEAGGHSDDASSSLQSMWRRFCGEHIDVAYYYVYAFSATIFLVGLVLWLNPVEGLMGKFTGTALFACGVFLMVNSDLVITFIRLRVQVHKFKKNNRAFERSLQEQSQRVRELECAASGFQELDKRFQGEVGQAAREVEQLEAVACSNLIDVSRHLCQLYCDKSKDQKVNLGVELADTIELLETVFGGIYRDFPMRGKVLKQAVEAHPTCQRDGGVEVRIFSQLVEKSLEDDYERRVPKSLDNLLKGIPDEAPPRRSSRTSEKKSRSSWTGGGWKGRSH